ncbi:MAG: universal stress protein, partial [Myxococcales bacterium]|nr:universal stress protein [Myxococcales bacterium]
MQTGYERILVPVDFSTNSARAVREAQRLLRDGGELLLIHVTEKFEPAIPWSATNRKLVTKLQREARSDARAGLEKMAAGLHGLRVRKRVESGNAEDRILEAARRERVGAIVVGAQG